MTALGEVRPQPRLIGTTMRRTEVRVVVVLQIAFFLMIVGNLLRISIFSTQAGARSVPVLPGDVGTIAFVAVGVMAVLLTGRARADSVLLIGGAFAILGGLTTVAGVWRFDFSASDVFISLAFLARWLLYFGVYFVVINSFRARDVWSAWSALETATLIFAAFGLFQSAFIPNFAQTYYPDSVPAADWDVQGRRLVSSYLDPNFAGALILMVLLVQIGMLSTGERVPRWKVLVLIAALIATLSRSSILGFVLGLLLIIAIRGLSKRLIGIFAVTFAVIIAALPALLSFAKTYNKTSLSDPSALGRLVSWARLWTVYTEHPIVGIGFNAWGAIARRRGWVIFASTSLGNDGGILFVLALTGTVGVLLYLGLLVAGSIRARRVWRDHTRQPYERGLSVAMPAIAVAYVFHSLFTNSLFHPLLMLPFFTLWGLGFVVANDPAPPVASS